MWVRCDGAFEAIVDPAVFYTAQGILLERHRRLSNDELLDRLRTLHEKFGRLSGILISETEGMPSPAVYRHRFASFGRTSASGIRPSATTLSSRSTARSARCIRG